MGEFILLYRYLGQRIGYNGRCEEGKEKQKNWSYGIRLIFM